MQTTISLTNRRFDGKRHRLQCSTHTENQTCMSHIVTTALHYLRFSVLRAQGFSLHYRTALLNFILDKRSSEGFKKAQLCFLESAPFVSEPFFFASGRKLKKNEDTSCMRMSFPLFPKVFRSWSFLAIISDFEKFLDRFCGRNFRSQLANK